MAKLNRVFLFCDDNFFFSTTKIFLDELTSQNVKFSKSPFFAA